MQHYTFTAQIEWGNEVGVYTARVPVLPGAHTQAESLDELKTNLKEVIELCLEEFTDEDLEQLPEFVGIQQIMIER